jgi:hypothetical protein
MPDCLCSCCIRVTLSDMSATVCAYSWLWAGGQR